MNKATRTPCAVPFCTRTVKGRWAHWICRDHWRLVDRDLKRLRTKMRQRFERRGEVQAVDGGHRWITPRGWRVCCALNRRMTRQAAERAAGISL